jgi:predicted MFS family arabinose efflux permease
VAKTADPSKTAPREQIDKTLRLTSDKRGFIIASVGLGLLTAHSGAPSPLFPLYTEQWGLTPLEISLVFAVYIVGLIATSLSTGSLSDHIGRRPVALISLFFAAGSMAVLVLADNFVHLVFARLLQGFASGLGFGTLGAALLDFTPPVGHTRVATINGALPPTCMGLGALLSGVCAEFLPRPLQLPYLVMFIALVLALIATTTLKEKHPRRPGVMKSLIPRLMVPREVRPRFVVAAGALCASWALGGLYMGIGPNVSKAILGIQSPTLGAVAILAVTVSGALTGIITTRLKAETVMIIGSVALLAGAGGVAIAAALSATVLYFGASVVAGIGFGAAFQGGLRAVLEGLAPVQRGGTISSLFLIAYVAFGVPTLAAGLLIHKVGLLPVLYGYAAFVALLAFVALALLLIGRAAERLP